MAAARRWRARADGAAALTRSEALTRLLEETGFAEAERTPLAGDASTRRYERLRLGDRRAVLMDAPPSARVSALPAGRNPRGAPDDGLERDRASGGLTR